MKRWTVVAFALLVAVAAAVYFTGGSSVELPVIETRGLEAPVREKVERLYAKARDEPTQTNLMALGRTLQAHQLNQPALAVYELAVDAGRRPFEALYLIGVILEGTDKRRAIEYFERAAEERNNEPLPQLRIGIALEELGEEDGAEAAYRRSLQLRPQPAAHLGLARLALGRGDVDRALAEVELVLEKSPREAAAWSVKSAALARAGRAEEARRAGELARALHPSPRGTIADKYLSHVDAEGVSFSQIKWRANLASSAGKLGAALRLATQAIEMEPDDPDARFERGLVLLQLLRFDEAIADARRARELRPGWARPYELEGTALGNSGRRDDARALFEKAVIDFPDDAGIHSGLATALMNVDDARALHHYERALELDPANTKSGYGRALLLARSHRNREAREQVLDLLLTAPAHADGLILLATLYFHSDNRPEALKVVRRLLEHYPEHPKGREMLRALGG